MLKATIQTVQKNTSNTNRKPKEQATSNLQASRFFKCQKDSLQCPYKKKIPITEAEQIHY